MGNLKLGRPYNIFALLSLLVGLAAPCPEQCVYKVSSDTLVCINVRYNNLPAIYHCLEYNPGLKEVELETVGFNCNCVWVKFLEVMKDRNIRVLPAKLTLLCFDFSFESCGHGHERLKDKLHGSVNNTNVAGRLAPIPWILPTPKEIPITQIVTHAPPEPDKRRLPKKPKNAGYKTRPNKPFGQAAPRVLPKPPTKVPLSVKPKPSPKMTKKTEKTHPIKTVPGVIRTPKAQVPTKSATKDIEKKIQNPVTSVTFKATPKAPTKSSTQNAEVTSKPPTKSRPQGPKTTQKPTTKSPAQIPEATQKRPTISQTQGTKTTQIPTTKSQTKEKKTTQIPTTKSQTKEKKITQIPTTKSQAQGTKTTQTPTTKSQAQGTKTTRKPPFKSQKTTPSLPKTTQKGNGKPANNSPPETTKAVSKAKQKSTATPSSPPKAEEKSKATSNGSANAAQSSNDKEERKPTNHGMVLIVGVLVGVVTFAAVIGFIIWLAFKEDSRKDPPHPDTSLLDVVMHPERVRYSHACLRTKETAYQLTPDPPEGGSMQVHMVQQESPLKKVPSGKPFQYP